MKSSPIGSLSLGLGLLLTPVVRAEMRAGAAAVDITPPARTPMAGYYHERGMEGVLDPLQAKALVLDDGATRIALVTLDLISTTRSLTEAVRAEVHRRTGISPGQIMISATHAHTGPELSEPGARGPLVGSTNSLVLTHTERLPGLISEAVAQAAQHTAPVQISVASGRCENLAYNRRFYLRDGTVGWNSGKLNPDIQAAAGTTDPEVGLVLIEPAHPPTQHVPAVAGYVNFAMHPDTVGGALASADYPGVLARRLAEYHGSNCVTLFANGTCGNLNHFDVRWVRNQGGPAEANRLGTILAASVFLAEKQLKVVPDNSLFRVKSVRVRLPLAPITQAEIAQARIDVVTARDNTREGFMRLVKGFQVLDIAAREGQPLEVEVQVIALGREVAWVSLPGEIFVELGLAIKKRSPFPQILIAELANGSIGYIPDRRSYAEGNYEPVSARCAAGSGEMLVDAASQLLAELYAAERPDR